MSLWIIPLIALDPPGAFIESPHVSTLILSLDCDIRSGETAVGHIDNPAVLLHVTVALDEMSPIFYYNI